MVTTAQKTGYDSVAMTKAEWLRIVPEKNPQVIGSYGNGRYANSTAAKGAFPNAIHIQYDVFGTLPAMDILDVEPGDAPPIKAPPWKRAHDKTAGPHTLPRAGIYCSASTVQTVITDMLDAGIKRQDFLVQSAHYGSGKHICGPTTCGYPQADATQYADKGLRGENTDLNVFAEHFFGAIAPPPPDPHYNLLADKPFLIFGNRYSERRTAMEYDKWRATQTTTSHPHRLRLMVLRARLSLLAGRVLRVAKQDNPPSWGIDHRGFRYQALIHRRQGERVI